MPCALTRSGGTYEAGRSEAPCHTTRGRRCGAAWTVAGATDGQVRVARTRNGADPTTTAVADAVWPAGCTTTPWSTHARDRDRAGNNRSRDAAAATRLHTYRRHDDVPHGNTDTDTDTIQCEGNAESDAPARAAAVRSLTTVASVPIAHNDASSRLYETRRSGTMTMLIPDHASLTRPHTAPHTSAPMYDALRAQRQSPRALPSAGPPHAASRRPAQRIGRTRI